ncbi:FXYD domain-containing ion transport regulator 3 [Bufo gargarizans]|uniref:FXYD domain-containing ion transport regulator 3 n=1 Tax=Bufo gargarizans TaxID=30331 RepID=UPI001CF490AE|nr:FXYD domain-containing ion transport regulator 3 [Bufo gargarizans]XP_044138507.1 FXYD domain-containing ion transport regulator 3 [Bufo gargarizans]
MQDVCLTLFLMLASTPLLHASGGAPQESDPFVYDYKTLQIAGLSVAAVLCVMGIIILISGKCRCKFNQKKDTRSRPHEQQLITPGSASHC